jgi:hypothetical protein
MANVGVTRKPTLWRMARRRRVFVSSSSTVDRSRWRARRCHGDGAQGALRSLKCLGHWNLMLWVAASRVLGAVKTASSVCCTAAPSTGAPLLFKIRARRALSFALPRANRLIENRAGFRRKPSGLLMATSWVPVRAPTTRTHILRRGGIFPRESSGGEARFVPIRGMDSGSLGRPQTTLWGRFKLWATRSRRRQAA